MSGQPLSSKVYLALYQISEYYGGRRDIYRSDQILNVKRIPISQVGIWYALSANEIVYDVLS